MRLMLTLVAMLIASVALNAQNAPDYGEDEQTCMVQLSTYTEFFKQENYKDAYTAWRWCYDNCPASTKNIYIHGPTILDYFVVNAENDEVKERYIDTLLMIYDQRIEYFGEEGRVKGRKGNDILRYRAEDMQAAYDLYKESIDLLGAGAEASVLGYFTNVSIVLFNDEVLTEENVVENYALVASIIDEQVAALEDGARKDRAVELGQKIEDMFVNSGAADCNAIIKIFDPQFDANPDDLALHKKIANIIEKTRSQECLTSDLYAKVSEAIYEKESSAEAAHKIAKIFYLKENYDKAETYYQLAAKMQEDESMKADLYYEFASLYLNQRQYAKARDYARRAIAANPSNGKAHILVARAYARGGTGCGDGEIDKVAIYWVVVDQLIKARNADPSVAEEANTMIRRYTAYFPTKEKLFWYNVFEGQSYTVGCWINETTTVRCVD